MNFRKRVALPQAGFKPIWSAAAANLALWVIYSSLVGYMTHLTPHCKFGPKASKAICAFHSQLLQHRCQASVELGVYISTRQNSIIWNILEFVAVQRLLVAVEVVIQCQAKSTLEWSTATAVDGAKRLFSTAPSNNMRTTYKSFSIMQSYIMNAATSY